MLSNMVKSGEQDLERSGGWLVNNLTFSQTTNLDSSKLKESADDNFKFDKDGREFSRWVENTVFSKDSYWRHEKIRACLGKG